MVLTSNYFLSFYSSFYRKQLPNITYASIFLLHFWAVYVAFMRNFEIDFLLPVSISIFIFSLVFDKFFKSLFFIFTITTFMMVMMLIGFLNSPLHLLYCIPEPSFRTRYRNEKQNTRTKSKSRRVAMFHLLRT